MSVNNPIFPLGYRSFPALPLAVDPSPSALGGGHVTRGQPIRDSYPPSIVIGSGWASNSIEANQS